VPTEELRDIYIYIYIIYTHTHTHWGGREKWDKRIYPLMPDCRVILEKHSTHLTFHRSCLLITRAHHWTILSKQILSMPSHPMCEIWNKTVISRASVSTSSVFFFFGFLTEILCTVKPRFMNLIHSWRSFVNQNYFLHRN
jgi:hypothetical protein